MSYTTVEERQREKIIELQARVAELEGALAETEALEMNHEGAVVRLTHEIEVQAAELDRLRARVAELEGAPAKASDLSIVEEVRGILLRNQGTPEPRLAEVIVAAVSERQAAELERLRTAMLDICDIHNADARKFLGGKAKAIEVAFERVATAQEEPHDRGGEGTPR